MNAHGRWAGTIDSLRTELAEVEKAKDTQIKELMTHLSRVDAKLAAELEKEAQIGESLAEERRKAEELERSLSEQTRSCVKNISLSRASNPCEYHYVKGRNISRNRKKYLYVLDPEDL